jgi:NAD(P)-dependent dehydrogenase (short-subunit alcohol dehydrogenase family)
MLIAPAAGAGPHAEPARAALVNLVRTLSVEWARYAITATTVLRGPDTTEEQLAALACFMASPGGDYLSGCPLTLGALAV